MQFESFTDALAMSGHGGYVWSVYLVALVVVVFLLVGPLLRSRRIMRERRGQLRREQVLQNKEAAIAPAS